DARGAAHGRLPLDGRFGRSAPGGARAARAAGVLPVQSVRGTDSVGESGGTGRIVRGEGRRWGRGGGHSPPLTGRVRPPAGAGRRPSRKRKAWDESASSAEVVGVRSSPSPRAAGRGTG